MSDEIPTTASEWIARMNAGPLPHDLEQAFQAWIASDSRNQADLALARLTRSVAMKLDTSDIAQSALRALETGQSSGSARWRKWMGVADLFGPSARRWAPAFAATMLIILSTVWILRPPSPGDDDARLQNGVSVSTMVGEISNHTLPDGSKVTLNAQSAVRVAFTRSQRQIVLEQGQAFFEVQADDKPFVVVAGLRSVAVTGTKFDVKLDSYRNGLQVAVVEGHVNVGSAQPQTDDITALGANDVFHFPDNGPPTRLALAAGLASAWQSRRLHFEGTKVGDVLPSVNRFAAKPLRLADPQLAELPFSGAFDAGDTEAVLFSLKSLYGLEATDTGNALILAPGP